VVEGCGDAARRDDTARQVADRWPLRDGQCAVRWCEDVGHATSRPIARAVKAAELRVPATHALATSADVDDLRVHGANVFDVDAGALQCSGPPVGEKDIAGFGQPQQDLAAGGRLQVEADAALASVGVLVHEGHGDFGFVWREAARNKPTAGIAGDRMLDLDHVGAPVRQNSTGGGDVDP
jgi:hypothetical protein